MGDALSKENSAKTSWQKSPALIKVAPTLLHISVGVYMPNGLYIPPQAYIFIALPIIKLAWYANCLEPALRNFLSSTEMHFWPVSPCFTTAPVPTTSLEYVRPSIVVGGTANTIIENMTSNLKIMDFV